MKILKYGEVTITKDGTFITNFGFALDEGESMGDAKESVLIWAMERLMDTTREEVVVRDVETGG